jgi:serine/threonine protein phosphatase PrpC
VLLIIGNTYYCANAGDARCLVYRKTGEHVFLSEDHKPDMEVEYKRIQKAGGYVVDGRVCENLNLTRAIGDLEYKKNTDLPAEEQIITANPDIIKKEFTEDDTFFVLGCDGIWELLTTE